MIWEMVVVVVLCLVYLLALKPRRLMSWYDRTITNLGYKVYNWKYSMLLPNNIKRLKADEESMGDCRYFSRTELYKYDVAISNIFNKVTLRLINPQLIKAFYQVDQQYYIKSSDLPSVLKKTLGEGLLFSQGTIWRKKRKVLTSVLNFQLIKDSIPNMVQSVNVTLDKMERDKFPTIYLLELSIQIFAHIFISSFIGKAAAQREVEGIPLSLYLISIIRQIGVVSFIPQVLILGPSVIDLQYRKIYRSLRHKIGCFRKQAQEIIVQKREAFVKREGVEYKHDNMLDAILRNNTLARQTDAHYFTDSDIINEIATFYFAAGDTTSRLFMMLIYCLDMNPTTKQKALEEIQSIVRSDSDINYQNLKKLKYLECVQKETLRIYPPTSTIIPREAVVDHRIIDIPIVKGTNVNVDLFSTHFNPEYFQNPTQFRPQRWEDGLLEKKVPLAVVESFGGGGRGCIGKQLAFIESKIAVVQFLTRYDYKMDKHNFKMCWNMLAEPEKLFITLDRRNQ